MTVESEWKGPKGRIPFFIILRHQKPSKAIKSDFQGRPLAKTRRQRHLRPPLDWLTTTN